MKFTDIISGAKLASGRAFCRIKAHSPEILLVAGVTGLIAGTVVACKSTLKAHKVIEEAKNSLDEIHDCEADEGLADKYTEEDAVNDKVHLFIKTAVKLTGLYAPSILLCGCSIACILLSHKIMSDQKAAAIAFGSTASAALAEYRNKVAEKYGKEVEEEIRYGVKTVKTTDPELYSGTDGSGEPVEKEEKIVGIGDASLYSTLIDEYCGVWDHKADLTLMALRSAERTLTDRLAARRTSKKPGYLFLREVYEYLEIPRERWPKDINLIGWLYTDEDSKNDKYVDFGPLFLLDRRATESGDQYIYSMNDPAVSYRDRAVLVDFNIDGVIYDKI